MTPEEAREMSVRMSHFTASCKRLEAPDIDEMYKDRWVAAYHGEVVAVAETLDGLCAAVDEKQIPRGECHFRAVGDPVDTRPVEETPWRPIDTAPQDDPILVARFRENGEVPDYVVSACFGTGFPGRIQCASYSGWFVDAVPLEHPPVKGIMILHGIVSRDPDHAPTHWMRMSK